MIGRGFRLDEIRSAERTAIEAWVATLTRGRAPGSAQMPAEAAPTRSRNWKRRLHAKPKTETPTQ